MAMSRNFIRSMGGAGFVIEFDGIRIGLDLYLSNSMMDAKGNFKRLVPPPVDPSTLELDYLIASHDHGDHLDTGCIREWFSRHQALKLIGPRSSLSTAGDAVPMDRKITLERGGALKLNSAITIRGVFCDHGDLSPDAIGVVFEIGKTRIYFTGDTCFRPDLQELTGFFDVDILIVPINPTFGNPGPDGAAQIVRMFKAKKVIPCHYWLFMEHGGDPASFASACATVAPDTNVEILMVGEEMQL